MLRTRRPRLTLPRTWRYEGRAFKLERGVYRWYVWSLDTSGTLASEPIVQAKLTVHG